jgi:DNA-binding GntR family transcriptional regulator
MCDMRAPVFGDEAPRSSLRGALDHLKVAIVQQSYKHFVQQFVALGCNDVHMSPPGEAPDSSAPPGTSWLQTVAGDIRLMDRASTAERVADVLRQRITEGDLPPRAHLSEEQLIMVLRVSRNTLREAFRLLSHEGLLVHELHRGVFVRQLDEADLVDLYRLRRAVECDVVRTLSAADTIDLQRLYDDVAEGESASGRGDWVAVGTANMQFHRDLVALARSPRTDQVTERLLAEMRLAFHAVASPQRLHETYVARNRALLELLAAGEFQQAAEQLELYLRDSLAELLDAMRGEA